jgi:hypothetical protein
VSEDNFSKDRSSTIGGTGSSRGSYRRVFSRSAVAIILFSLTQEASAYCPGIR